MSLHCLTVRSLPVLLLAVAFTCGATGCSDPTPPQQPSSTSEPKDKAATPETQLDPRAAATRWKRLGAQVTSNDEGQVTAIIASGPNVIDDGLYDLSAFPLLTDLNLEYSEISDAGLSQLGTLKQLTSLVLLGTEISDTGLAHLHGLSLLETLDLEFTSVSEGGLEKLKQALPNCEINR
jgi:hypothetical protein